MLPSGMLENSAIDALLPEPMLARADMGTAQWWQDVAIQGTPLQLARDGQQVQLTFLWREQPELWQAQPCAAVYIDMYSHTPHPTDQLTSFTKIPGSDVWVWQTVVPDDWRGSYFLMPVMADDLPPQPDPALNRRMQIRHWWINSMQQYAVADQLNRTASHAGAWGGALSQILLGNAPLYAEWVVADQQKAPAVQGQLEVLHWHSSLLGNQLSNQRQVWCYATTSIANAATEDLPLVLLLDGQYWASSMPIFSVLDALTDTGRLPAAVYVLIDSVSPAQRGQELPCNAIFWQAVQQELLPMVQAIHPVTDRPEKTIVAGQSFGGLAAMYAGLHWPQRFGAVISQSGSFWWPDAHNSDETGWLTLQVQQGLSAGQTLRVFQEIGCYEHSMLQDNRVLRQALIEAGHQVFYQEFRGGHDWICWRDGLLQGLIHMLGHHVVAFKAQRESLN